MQISLWLLWEGQSTILALFGKKDIGAISGGPFFSRPLCFTAEEEIPCFPGFGGGHINFFCVRLAGQPEHHQSKHFMFVPVSLPSIVRPSDSCRASATRVWSRPLATERFSGLRKLRPAERNYWRLCFFLKIQDCESGCLAYRMENGRNNIENRPWPEVGKDGPKMTH